MITLTQNQENGMAGIISAIGKFFSLAILKPVASIKKPPQALIIIVALVIGRMNWAKVESKNKTMNCGMATTT